MFFSKLPAGKYIQMTIFRNLLLLKLVFCTVFKCIVHLSINTVKKSTIIYTYGTSSQNIFFYQFYFCLKSLEQTRKFIHQNPIPVLRDWWASYLCLEFCPVTKAQWAMGCPQQCPVLAKQTNLLMCLWILRDAGSDKASILKLTSVAHTHLYTMINKNETNKGPWATSLTWETTHLSFQLRWAKY